MLHIVYRYVYIIDAYTYFLIIQEEITSSTYLTRKSKLISLERPLEELHYFHVLHVINTVLQVSDTRTKTLCIIKVELHIKIS